MSWFCKCGAKTSGAFDRCCYTNYKPNVEHYQVSENTIDFHMIAMAVAFVGKIEGSYMTEQEELYADFYKKGKIFVKDMDMTQLREHRDELSKIAFQAKATLAAADDELRERKAGLRNKEWTITPTGPDQVTSDAINAVKVRKDRMTKLDKIRAQLLNSLDEATVNEMMSNLERKATEVNLKKLSFGKPLADAMTETVIDVPVIEEPKKPNPFAAMFNKKNDKETATLPEE